jgi:amino acid permease
MASIIDILILGLPLMMLSLLVGLGACIAVITQEGRGRTSAVSHVTGLINLLLIIPLSVLATAAETRDVRFMFMFAAGAFALVGLLGLRLPQRFRD